MNLDQLGNLAHGMTLCDQPTAEGHLVGCERGRSAETHVFLLCRDAPRTGAAQDQGALELGGMRCTAYRRLCGARGYAEWCCRSGSTCGVAH